MELPNKNLQKQPFLCGKFYFKYFNKAKTTVFVVEPAQQTVVVMEPPQQNGYICTIITNLHGTAQLNLTKTIIQDISTTD